MYRVASAIQEVVIVSGARTPIGSFRGALASLTGPQLGSLAVDSAVQRAGIPKDAVQEIYYGCAIEAGMGQGPSRQVALGAGLSNATITTEISKLCASGMKSVMLAAQSLMLGHQEVIVAGGMESMSRIPFLVPRGEIPYGGIQMKDALLDDGYICPFVKAHSGKVAENTAKVMEISRQQQDEFAVGSYKKSAAATQSGILDKEIVHVAIPGKKGKPDVVVKEDEEYKRINFEKVSTLPPAFQREGGTITAANASPVSDGAAACVLMTAEAAERFKVKPLARIVAFADAANAPIDFAIAPSLAVPKILEKCNIKKEDIAMWEINEAFSVVVLANIKLLDIDPAKVNINGGAVSLGHPAAMSGTRLINHMALNLKSGDYGLATICNGGGGASAIIIQKL